MFGLFSYDPQYVNFENVQQACQRSTYYILINVLSIQEQDCLIKGTIDASLEEQIVNEMLSSIVEPDKPIIVYGKNNQDKRVIQKATQLHNLGVKQVYIYQGGMVEWLLLQDIYGDEQFSTTKRVIDLLKYRSTMTRII